MKPLKDFQIEKIHRRLSFGLVIFLALVLVAGIGILAKFGDLSFAEMNIAKKSSENSKREFRTISGIPSCLPLKSGDTGRKCEYGIKTKDGLFYALSNNQFNSKSLTGEAGANGIEITGEFIPASQSEEYDIVGTIVQ